MRGVVLVPNDDPLKMEVLWLDNGFAMYYTRWEYIDGYPWGPDQSGVADFLGGKFTSPPAAISPAPNRLDVFGLGQDYAVYQNNSKTVNVYQRCDDLIRLKYFWRDICRGAFEGGFSSSGVCMKNAKDSCDPEVTDCYASSRV